MGFFDFNNPQHRQMAQAHNSGDYSQLDPSQVAATYKGFVDHGPEDQVQAVHQEYFNQMPKVEQMGLFSSLINTAKQNGIDPSQAGISTTDPHQATSFDLGNLFNLARNSGLLGGMFGGGQSQSGLGSLAGQLIGNSGGFSSQNQTPNNEPNSGGLGGFGNILNNPIAQAALGGLVSYAANKAFGGNQSQAAQPANNQTLPGPQSLPPTGQNLPPEPQSDFRM
ncbi:MAG: hypothetical protein J0I20_21660 [Chloroflexi bacterium]|nr:hypothetical protein [Chloroflexota bacterium]OJV99837.1 MAG: hypothetical protein BGO39_29095 [Chloroflexi bacterium 54-19]